MFSQKVNLNHGMTYRYIFLYENMSLPITIVLEAGTNNSRPLQRPAISLGRKDG